MSLQEPSHYAEDDMVLVAGSDYVRMASIGGGLLSIKLPTSSDSTPVVESLASGTQIAVNGGTYVDEQRLGALYMRESGDGTTVSNSNYVMMYNPNGNPLKEITYSDDIPNHLNIIDASLNGSTIAIGSGSNATGTNSVAIGNNASTSTYDNSVALGNGATAGANNAIILGDGTQNVGIGESNPDNILHVRGNGPQLILEGQSNENSIIRFSAGPSYGDKYHEIVNEFYALAGNGHQNKMHFKVNEGGQFNSPGTRMTIRGDGNVGIGDTNPDAKLHVRGNGPQLILEGQSNEDSMVRLSAGPSYQNRFHEIRAQHYALAGNGYRNYLRFKVNNGGQDNPSDTMSLNGDGNLNITGSYQSSDDRIKKNEVYITNAIETLIKLKPQLYDKYLVNDSSSNVLELSENFVKESGLIVQELYYDAPELRHLVMYADDAYDLSNNISSLHDPQVDPDYSMWGSKPASLNYCGLISYLIKGIQEQQEEIEAEKAKTATLETKVSSLESQLSDILSRLSTLENP